MSPRTDRGSWSVSATKKPMAPGRRAKCAAARGLVLAFRVSRGTANRASGERKRERLVLEGRLVAMGGSKHPSSPHIFLAGAGGRTSHGILD